MTENESHAQSAQTIAHGVPRRPLTEAEQNGGAVYGTCPEGHGDHNGRIAAEVSFDRRPYPNCPVCGHRLEDTEVVAR